MTALELLQSLNLLDETERIELSTEQDTLAASAALRRLRDAGLLVQKGKGSATYYLPAERLGLSKNTGENNALSGNPGTLSTNPQGLSTNPGTLSGNPQPSAEETARAILLDHLPGALAARIGGFGQRHPPGEVCDAVVELCSLREWSAEELATVLGRHPRYVRNNYLRPLMRDGRLAMTNPEEPHDPQQAYRAVMTHKH